MQSKHPLQDMLEPEINRLGFDVVRILTIGQKNPTLQIMICLLYTSDAADE